MPENAPKDIEVVFSREELPNRERKEILEKLRNRIGEQNVSDEEIDRISYSRDCWPMSIRWMLEGKIAARPDWIVWPITTKHVSEVIMLANEEEIPVIPFGEGSGVVGGAIPVKGGIIVDMKKMKRKATMSMMGMLV